MLLSHDDPRLVPGTMLRLAYGYLWIRDVIEFSADQGDAIEGKLAFIISVVHDARDIKSVYVMIGARFGWTTIYDDQVEVEVM